MTRKIMLVGEAYGEQEEREGMPFVGPSGKLLNAFLSAQGIVRSECHITNVFNFRPPDNNLVAHVCGPRATAIPALAALETSKWVRLEFYPELQRLWREVHEVNPNVVVALGSVATWALLGDPRITRHRGSPAQGHFTPHKVLPTYHPAAVLRNYKLRPIVFADFAKIRRESEYPEVRRPEREFWLRPTLADLAAFEPFILSAREKLSVDIETWAKQITMIGFAPDERRAIVIPFVWRGTPDGNYWRTLSEEVEAWRFVRRWMQAGVPLLGQNFNYDLTYMMSRYGIVPSPAMKAGYNLPPVNDTMLLAHAAQPEMEKSLALLSSLYTNEPQHKFMRGANDTTLRQSD